MAITAGASLSRMARTATVTVRATYVDFDEATYTQERNFMERTFLVSGEFEPLEWKLPGDEASILGHHVLKATAMKDTISVEAWFAPGIPVPGGPALYGGLPGLILMLSLDEGHETYTAAEVDLETVPEFEKPSKGRSVTVEKFDQIVADKLAELEKTKGGRNNVKTIIIRQ